LRATGNLIYTMNEKRKCEECSQEIYSKKWKQHIELHRKKKNLEKLKEYKSNMKKAKEGASNFKKLQDFNKESETPLLIELECEKTIERFQQYKTNIEPKQTKNTEIQEENISDKKMNFNSLKNKEETRQLCYEIMNNYICQPETIRLFNTNSLINKGSSDLIPFHTFLSCVTNEYTASARANEEVVGAVKEYKKTIDNSLNVPKAFANQINKYLFACFEKVMADLVISRQMSLENAQLIQQKFRRAWRKGILNGNIEMKRKRQKRLHVLMDAHNKTKVYKRKQKKFSFNMLADVLEIAHINIQRENAKGKHYAKRTNFICLIVEAKTKFVGDGRMLHTILITDSSIFPKYAVLKMYCNKIRDIAEKGVEKGKIMKIIKAVPALFPISNAKESKVEVYPRLYWGENVGCFETFNPESENFVPKNDGHWFSWYYRNGNFANYISKQNYRRINELYKDIYAIRKKCFHKKGILEIFNNEIMEGEFGQKLYVRFDLPEALFKRLEKMEKMEEEEKNRIKIIALQEKEKKEQCQRMEQGFDFFQRKRKEIRERILNAEIKRGIEELDRQEKLKIGYYAPEYIAKQKKKFEEFLNKRKRVAKKVYDNPIIRVKKQNYIELELRDEELSAKLIDKIRSRGFGVLGIICMLIITIKAF